MLITGATPYLGGPWTWRPLREAAPDLSFVEIDPLDFADAPDLNGACRRAVLRAARDSDAVVAHYTAAKPAIEALAQMPEAPPLLLLSPLLVRRSTPPLSAMRAVIETRLGGRLLASLAHSKSSRLSSDRQYLKKQLLMFLDEAHLTDALFEEATARAKDSRTTRSVERVAQIFLEITNPIDPEIDAKVNGRTVLLGTSRLDRKMATRIPATTLPNVRGAPMIEAPQVVAQALRKMLTMPVNR